MRKYLCGPGTVPGGKSHRDNHSPLGLSIMPAITALGSDAAVALLAQSHKVIEIMCAAFAERNDVVYLLRRRETSLSVTLLAERVSSDVPVSYLSPLRAVPLRRIVGTLVLIVFFISKPLVLLAVPSFCKVRTARIGTGLLRLSRHDVSPFC